MAIQPTIALLATNEHCYLFWLFVLLLYEIQLVSCSFFVPVPAIVVKSHQQLESILPYLPIPPSLSSALTFKSAHPPATKTDSATVPTSPPSVTLHRGNRIHKPAKERNRHRHHYVLDSNESGLHDPQYPSSTTCIRISLKPNPSLQFLRLQLSRKKSILQGYPSTHHHQHPLHNHHRHHHRPHYLYHDHLYYNRYDSDYENDNDDDPYNLHYYNFSSMPRITPVLFTFPFPPQDQHCPSSVQVTGTFDDWQRTAAPLTKNDQERRFEAEIQVDLERLPQIHDDDDEGAASNPRESLQPKRKLVYKFVLDGHNWLTDPTQPNERDYEGNLNNICFLKDRTLTETQQLERQEAERKAKEAEDEATIQKLGGGLWGTPNFAVNDPILPPSDLAGNNNKHDLSSNNCDGGGGEMTNSATTKTLVDPPTTTMGASTAGDAKPLQDGSITTTMASAEMVPHSPSQTTGDEHDGDGDYGVAILQGDPVTISPLQRTPSTEAAAAGDAYPTVDASIAAPASASAGGVAGGGNAPLSINTATSNASASASAPSLVSSMSSHPTSSSNAQTPTSPTGNSKGTAMPKLYGVEAIKDNGAVKSAVPTTAISTTTPQFPSSSSLAVQSGKTGGRKKSLWKRLKKVFS
ncbi:hypothetical protein BGZ75_005317 [Mortierella antarctica]|nr:hypothetical protein BGZ75_005317 [Mortierella antarctica]